MRSLWKLTVIEFKMFYREPIAMFFTLVFPLMMLFIFGSIYGNEPTPFFGGVGFIDTAVPSYTAMIIAMTGLISVTMIFSSYRESGILRRLQATPLSPQAILSALVIIIFLLTGCGMIVLVIAGKLVYNLQFLGNPFKIALAFTLGSFSFFSIGFVLSGLLKTARTAQIAANMIYFPMIFLSGATIPLEVLPSHIRQINQFLPLTHVVTLLRGLWVGNGFADHIKEITVLGGMMVVFLVLSVFTFRWE
ncbi:ABC transporter permease [candidate division KSB1 bacterium]